MYFGRDEAANIAEAEPDGFDQRKDDRDSEQDQDGNQQKPGDRRIAKTPPARNERPKPIVTHGWA